jgi:8-oxo-dGTP diphosphatase
VTVEVVAAVLVRNGRIFLQQRPAAKDFPFCWESPGGKVEPGESHYLALHRELLEELGVEIDWRDRNRKPIWTGHFENLVTRPDRASIVLHFYYVGDRFSGAPTVRDGQPGFGWFAPGEMVGLSLAPANARANEVLVEAVNREVAHA